jgi:hypothetical protein
VNFCTACSGCSVLLRSQATVGCAVYDDYYKKVLREVRKRT